MEKDVSLYLLSAIVQGTKKVTMQNRGFIFLLYLLLDFIGSFSQSNLKIFYPVNNQVLQQYNIRSLTTDRDGKLWLSTDNGLLSYDGNDVKIFKHDDNDPSSLSSDNVSKTYPDLKGNLYVINDLHEKNLSLMDGKTGKCVFEVAHRHKESTIYWHLDENYLGATKEFHQMALAPPAGKHLLVLVDENGERLEQYFEVVKK